MTSVADAVLGCLGHYDGYCVAAGWVQVGMNLLGADGNAAPWAVILSAMVMMTWTTASFYWWGSVVIIAAYSGIAWLNVVHDRRPSQNSQRFAGGIC